MNLSQTFTAFAKEASPLGDNLAIVLYNEDNIMDLLVRYIEMADALATEPLLNLMSHFAHDLDIRFEKHFSRAVKTVAAVAAAHPDFTVIEWSFTCLAWLFKYLSRLLAPDLRPLYNLLAPYLGRDQQKPFIVRFTAEALSFLLRKSALSYARDPIPLDSIIAHMFDDCDAAEGTSKSDLYQQGLTTLISESIKGVQCGLHTCGTSILQSVLRYGVSRHIGPGSAIVKIILGALTSVIHHCTTETFQPILSVVLQETIVTARFTEPSESAKPIYLTAQLLFTIASVRKGSRIKDWTMFMNTVVQLVQACEPLESVDRDIGYAVLSFLAVAMHTATIDAALVARDMPELVRTGKLSPFFLEFCDLFNRLDSDRFDSLVSSQFQLSLAAQKTIPEQRCLALIATLGPKKKQLKLSPEVVTIALDELDVLAKEDASSDAEALSSLELRLGALKCTTLSAGHATRLQKILSNLLTIGLARPEDPRKDLALGSALSQLLELTDLSELSEQFWTKLCEASPRCMEVPLFWSNLLCLAKGLKISTQGSHIVTLESALLQCLSCPSHSIRQDSIDLLASIYQARGVNVPNGLAILTLIESTEISLNTARTISLNIRRLLPEFASLAEDDFMAKALPSYCFGLLHVHLAQAWTDAIAALAAFVQTKWGEESVINLAQKWIDADVKQTDEGEAAQVVLDMNSAGFKVFSDFECPNLAKLSAITQQVFFEPLGGLSASSTSAGASEMVPYITSNSRSQALRVLDGIPSIAEKRSRLLVPVLLRWAGNATYETDNEIGTAVGRSRWSRKDQKAMLGIFAQFVNPRVLYKAAEVHAALLHLCANGDVEIQRSTLKAVLAWKEPVLVRHQEHLINLLDDARFRETILVFLQNDSEEDQIRQEDYHTLMPVLLRLLYGRAVAGGKDGQSGRRKAIFVALSRFGDDILEQFFGIAISPLSGGDSMSASVLDEQQLRDLKAPLRQQLGLLNMMGDMLQTLGAEMERIAVKLLNAALLCTVTASRQLFGEPEGSDIAQTSLLRSVRQNGIQCLVKIFASVSQVQWQQYKDIIVDELITPRLDLFSEENAQSISGMLRLFGAWTEHNEAAKYFTGPGDVILGRLADLLRGQHTKDEVKIFVMEEIMNKLLRQDIDASIVQPRVNDFVRSIDANIEQQPSKTVLDASVASFSLLAERITSSQEAASVIKTCTSLLKKPSKEVSQHTKTGLLKTLLPLVAKFDLEEQDELYNVICPLFSRLYESKSRTLLAQVLSTLVRRDEQLLSIAKTCEDMTAQGSRLDEPDYDRRERAFLAIYKSAETLNLQQWLPVVHTCLFFMRDAEDKVNRTSASHALKLFTTAAAEHRSTDSGWTALLDDTLFPGVEYGMRAPSELVRAEFLDVLGHVVEKIPSLPKVKGMEALIVGGDEEASFFANAMHVQQHRRLRALRRLSEEAGGLNSQAVTRIFLPLLEHFVFDQAEGDAGRTLADQAVQTIGELSKAVNWSSFRATFQRYTSYLKSKPDLEKVVLRLLGALVDGLNKDTGRAHSDGIIRDHLPPLLEYLHQKDESTVDRRMPVAITIVKLLQMLPDAEFAARLPAVLTDVSHVLRSRSTEARDQTRKSLSAISSLIGPFYFSFILKELRSALKRGYQLHVLSYTVHSLIVSASFEPGDLAECLPELMLVIMDDIFGVTGQEKDAEEYKSGMKEVKSSKSYDTMEILARVTPVGKLGQLIRPIRDLLSEKVNLHIVNKIDDLLTRLRKGLDQNPASEKREMLSFCWEIISQVHAEDAAAALPAAPIDERAKRYLVMPDARQTKGKTTAFSFRFKLVSFSLNLLRKVIRRHEDLQTPQNMSGFLPIAGDALIQSQEEVKLAAVRFLSTIMSVAIPSIDTDAPVYVKEAVLMVKNAANTTAEASKAALELITSVLRERRTVSIKEKDIATILKSIKGDVDEPDRQGVIYRFLRAVVGRKIVITEVYEVMDEVGKAIVTNPDRSIRDSARSAYLQFVMEFPQGKDRWQKQTTFMVGNLQYEHASGRQSIMEFMHSILSKVGDEVLEEMAVRMFVSLLPILVGDVDGSCREMAGLLISKLYERASEKKLLEMLAMMDTWLQKNKKSTTKAGALQCWSLLLRADRASSKQLENFRSKAQEVLAEDTEAAPQISLEALKAFSVLVELHSAIGFGKKSAQIWTSIQSIPDTSEEPVRELVAKLMGDLFTDFASTSSKAAKGLASVPLRGSGGLELDAEDMRRLCAVHLRALRVITANSPETFVMQSIRNLVFLGRCFALNGVVWRGLTASEEAEEEDDGGASDEEEVAGQPSSEEQPAMTYLVMRLSKLVLRPDNSPSARLAAMSSIIALLPHLPAESLPIRQVLRPLYALTDPSIPNPPTAAFKSLEDRAHEVMDAVQKKLGNQAYVTALAVTRSEAKARRDSRRQKRRIEAVNAPERFAQEKRRRHEVKKLKAKAKGEEARGRRRGW